MWMGCGGTQVIEAGRRLDAAWLIVRSEHGAVFQPTRAGDVPRRGRYARAAHGASGYPFGLVVRTVSSSPATT